MKTLVCIFLIAVPMMLLAQAPYLKKYAGTYSIMVGNDGSEAYALAENGSAVWINGWKDSSGKLQTQKKSGSWTAGDGNIKVTINGNTGKIIQEYKIKNGRFVSVDDSRTYLKKN
jgi:hypothetical protein